MVGLIQGTGGGQRQRHVQGRLRRGRCATHGLPLHRGTTQVTGADGQERITKKIGRNIVYIFIWYIHISVCIIYVYIIIIYVYNHHVIRVLHWISNFVWICMYWCSTWMYLTNEIKQLVIWWAGGSLGILVAKWYNVEVYSNNWNASRSLGKSECRLIWALWVLPQVHWDGTHAQ